MPKTFEEFISISNPNIPILEFSLNLILSATLAFLLKILYVKYGNSLSNRKQFGNMFLLLSMTTMLIITIVKSSLALSLGLVGALSIIRFRSAIKEPEELSFLFISIAIGLGLGANQTVITICGFCIIAIIIIITRKILYKSYNIENLQLIIQSYNTDRINITSIIEILNKFCDRVDLRRLDETNDNLEVSFLVEAINYNQFNGAKEELKKIDKNLKITFIDNKGIL